jgi:hypothetical protein
MSSTALALLSTYEPDSSPGHAATMRLCYLKRAWTPLDRAEAARALRANAIYYGSRGRAGFAVESASLAGLLEGPVRQVRVRWNKGGGQSKVLRLLHA